MQKNVAGQKIYVFAFNETDNTPVTGDAANITCNLRIDGGTADAVDDTNPTELEQGYYVFDSTQAETNGDNILVCPQSSTSNVQVVGVPGLLITTPPNFPALGIESDGDLAKVNSLDGHTVQTGDSYAIVNNGTYGNSAIETLVDDIETLLTNGTYGLSAIETLVDEIESRLTAVRAEYLDNLNISETVPTQAEINAQVDTALSDIGLDHMVSASVAGADVTDNSIMAKIASKSATADWDSFNNTTDSLEALSDSGGGDATAANQTTIIANQDAMKGSGFLTATDSLEAIRNRGDAAWLTGGGLSGSNSVTLTFQDELSANVVEVAVEIWDEPGTTFYEKTFSNSNGQTTHNIDDGVYTIKAHKAGYRFENTSLTLPAELTKTITATSYTPSPPTDPALCKIYTYLKYNDGSIPGTVESTLRVKNIPYAVSNNLFSQFEMAGTYDSSTGLLYWEVQREAKCTIHIDQFLNDNITIPDQELEEIGDLI